MDNFLELLNESSQKRVLIIGDFILDKFIFGDSSRLSSEYPIPVFEENQIEYRLGGSGNVAKNTKTFGLNTDILTVIGNQESDQILLQLCSDCQINHDLVINDQEKITPVKSRYICDKYQSFRSDLACNNSQISHETCELFLTKLSQVVENYNAVILSDYGYGILSDELTPRIIEICNRFGVRTLVDPKRGNYLKFKNATLIKPNREDAEYFCSFKIQNQKDAINACKEFINQLKIQHCVLTMAGDGMILYSLQRNLPIQIETPENIDVIDVTGAGDTVISTLGFGLVHRLELEETCRLANYSASTVITRIGTVPVNLVQLLRQFNNVITSYSQLRMLKDIIRASSQKIIMTTGCFDLMHQGHIESLQKAKNLGGILVVALNSDVSITQLKGSERPICPLSSRLAVLRAIKYVDFIMIFDELTPLQIFNTLEPDILVKGGDYDDESIRKIFPNLREFVAVELVPDISTSIIVDKIKSLS